MNYKKGFIGGGLLAALAVAAAAVTGLMTWDAQPDWSELEESLQEQNKTLLNTQAELLALQAQLDLEEEQRLGAFYQVGGLTYTLAGAGVGSSDTTITLTSFKAPVSGANLVTGNFGEIGYMTLEPGNSSRQEFISFTGVTQNANGSATLTGVSRGLAPVYPYTASSTYQKQHPGGTQAALSNSPAFYTQFPKKANDETITGQWTFSTFPVTASSSFASTTASGWVELATGTEAASSTASGDIAASKLALHTGLSTSTAPASGHVVPVTDISGQIDDGFLTYAAPVASITAYASTTAPTGWLLADGTAVSRTTYSALFAILGTSYGVGDGSTTFNLPDIRGRSIAMASSTQTATSTYERDTLGDKGGSTTHTQTVGELASHTHGGIISTTGNNVYDNGAVGGGTASQNTSSTGSGTAFNILDPYIILNYIIKY